jgi:hypothetical protein
VYTVYVIWYVLYGIYMVYGIYIWYMVYIYVMCYVLYGIWYMYMVYMVCVIWYICYVVCGIWYMVYRININNSYNSYRILVIPLIPLINIYSLPSAILLLCYYPLGSYRLPVVGPVYLRLGQRAYPCDVQPGGGKPVGHSQFPEPRDDGVAHLQHLPVQQDEQGRAVHEDLVLVVEEAPED